MQSNPYTEPHRAATVRVAMWSARHRWSVLILWFAFIAALVGVGLLGMGMKVLDFNDPGTAQFESAKAGAIWQAASEDSPDELVMVITHPTLKVSDSAYQASVEQIVAQLRTVTYNDGGVQKPSFTQVNDYYSTHSPALVSPDNTTTRIIAPIVGKSGAAAAKYEPAKPVIQQIKDQYKDFTIYAFSNASINQEFQAVVEQDLQGTLYITLPMTFLILLLAFGAVAAAVIPLLLALTSLAASFSILAIYSQLISAVDTSAGDVVILIGLAVGVDYSLFLITRYRTERRRGRDKLTALEIASSTSGRAVFFSGLAVMISLAGLFFVDDPTFSSMAVGTIAVVLISVVGSLTFLPALLSILGKGIDWGRIPYFGRDREEGSGVWSRIISVVMSRPAIFAGGTLILLLALASPILHLNLGITNFSIEAMPKKVEYRQAALLMEEKWPQGTILHLNAVVQADTAARTDVKTAITQFSDAALKLDGLSGPPEITTAPNGKVTMVSFLMSGTPDSSHNKDLVSQVRSQTIPTYFHNLSGVQVYVSGRAALTLDIVKLFNDKLLLILIFVLGLSFLLLLVAFRSLVIPFKAILLNLLSVGAAYGAVVLVFQDGWFSQPLGFQPLPVVESWVPIFLFTILFGLSMDYHLFVLTRVKEEKDKGLPTSEAVARGITFTSGTITSAAAIMVVVFAAFVGVQLMSIRQLGLGLAVAVFVDATIIRCILLPTTMRLLGEWNWWLPRFLDWLPHVTIEGEAALAAPLPVPLPVEALASPIATDERDAERELVEV